MDFLPTHTVNTIKVQIKNNKSIFFELSEGMENCKMSEKTGNFEVDDK